MKNFVLTILALTTLSSAHAAERVSFFLLGVQYERDTTATDAVRFGVGLPLALALDGGGVLALSGDVAYLRRTAPTTESVQPYYGGGLGLATVLATGGGSSVGLVSLYPHVLGGANFNLSSTLGLFAEASVGPNVAFGTAISGGSTASAANVTLGYGVRLGVNYTFR